MFRVKSDWFRLFYQGEFTKAMKAMVLQDWVNEVTDN